MKVKNKNFIIAIICLMVVVGGLILYIFLNKNNLVELTVDEVIEKINNKESFVLCISQTTCSHCDSYKPKLEDVANKYGIKLFYIDIDKYKKDEISNFKKYITYDNSTPVTAFIIDGVEPTASNRIIGNSNYSKIVTKLKNAGFINE